MLPIRTGPTGRNPHKEFDDLPEKTTIAVAHGDGIGPEIMQATLRVLDAAGAALETETVQIGEAVYKKGFTSGIEALAWDTLRRTKVFLKAPIFTPQRPHERHFDARREVPD